MPLISIVVPCYNEAQSLPLFFDALKDAALQLEERGVCLECIFVNDGSKDHTLQVIEDLCLADSRVRLLSFSRNFGKEAAMLSGLKAAMGDYAAVMDADLQDPPSLLPRLYDLILETGCDCAATRRFTRSGEPPVRSAFARGFYRLMNVLSPIRLEDGVRDFRLMSREMLNAVLSMSEKRRFSKGLFAYVGFDTRVIAYENVERAAGESKWSFFSLLRYAIEGIFALTGAPLLLPPLFCALLLVSAFLLLCFSKFTAALLCALGALFQACVLMLCLYLSRILAESRRRPLYFLKKEK